MTLKILKFKRLLYGILFLMNLISCKTENKIIEINLDKSLIPEGIAFNHVSGNIYLSSIHKNKITQTSTKLNKTTNFIKSNEYGYASGVGMIIYDNKLFALNNNVKKHHSALYVFDLKKNTLISKYVLDGIESHFFNDLTISNNNEIFITDTKHNSIYKLNFPDGELEEFFKSDDIKYPNGIAISDDDTKLFVASWVKGIKIIEVKTRKILNKENETAKGIDGLKYHKGNLYGIRNSVPKKNHGLIKIELTNDLNNIKKTDHLLINHEYMNMPTTIDISDDVIYILANSQLKNLNQVSNQIIDIQKLTNTYINE